MALAALLTAPAAGATSLEDTLTAAYQSNPRIKQERQRLQSVDENIAQATSNFRPSVNADYSRGHQEVDRAGTVTDGSITNKTLTLEQPLFRGGGTFSSLNSARQLVKSGQYALSAVEQQVMLDTVTAYMDVVTNASILELSRNNESVLSEQLKAAETQFEVGSLTRTDVAQSQSRLSDARTAVISADGQLQSVTATFERIAGFRPTEKLDIPEQLPTLPLNLDEALSKARSANPDLLSAIHLAKSSRYDIKTNEATLLPNVSLVGTMSRQDGPQAFGGSGTIDQDRIALQMNIPLYQGGAEYSRIRAAKAIARQRDYSATDMRQAVDESVTQAWAQLQNAVSTISARNDQIKAAQLALEGVKQEQQFGTRTLLDVLNAEQELFAAKTDLIRAERDRVVAAYALAFRLGELTPQRLGLKVDAYDPKEHADDISWKPIGF